VQPYLTGCSCAGYNIPTVPYNTVAVGYRKEDYQPGAASQLLTTHESTLQLSGMPALSGLDAFLTDASDDLLPAIMPQCHTDRPDVALNTSSSHHSPHGNPLFEAAIPSNATLYGQRESL
jgi:hypothetical protein